MKILFVINSFLAGGAERSLVELLPELRASGVEPVIACLRRRDIGFEDEVRAAGHDVRMLPDGGWMTRIRGLRSLIKDLEPALIYTSLFDADITGRIAAWGLDVPVMSNLANTAYDPVRMEDPNVEARKLRVVKAIDGFTSRHLTDSFHAVSQAVKDSTVTTLGVDPDKIFVVKRGRDGRRLGEPSPERRLRVRRELSLEEDAEVLITVGRQEFQKGHRFLIEAFAPVAAARPRAVLLIVGRKGNSTSDLNRRLAALGLGDRLQMLGHRPDVPDLLAAADIFVFPSLYEGLGGALIEALALGLPVVASDIPALREVVHPGENADMVPPGDAVALADAISAMLSEPEQMERYGKVSREIFLQEFRAEDATQRMIDLLMAQAG